MAKNNQNTARTLNSLKDLATVKEFHIDMSGVHTALADKFFTAFSAIDEANTHTDIALAAQAEINKLNVELSSLREQDKRLSGIIDAARISVDKAFASDHIIRERGIWMRDNNRANEWNETIKSLKNDSINDLAGNELTELQGVSDLASEIFESLKHLDEVARKEYAIAAKIKADAGFAVKGS